MITAVSGADSILRMGRVSFGGLVKDVSLAYTPEAGVGDYVIVHAGFAISVLDRAEAESTLEFLEQLSAEVSEENRSDDRPL